jgi:hypothetical protein
MRKPELFHGMRPKTKSPSNTLHLALATVYGALLLASCSFDSGLRWAIPEPVEPPKPICEIGERRCTANLEVCGQDEDGLAAWQVEEDCAAQDKVCASSLLKCTECLPGETFCSGQQARRCSEDGLASSLLSTCNTNEGEACRSGSCPNLCVTAAVEKSNVGCEYWAVDLDNAMIDATKNAQAQQYAVVVSNPQPDVAAKVKLFRDDGKPGDPPAPVLLGEAVIAPLNLRVFKLGPREVDGSTDGMYNNGSHTALSRHAYKITSDFPVVAYQFNPLENVNVFSNDASLLKPREALSDEPGQNRLAYVVAGWPQTIAITNNPDTNFSAASPINLRAFLTIVGTAAATRVTVRPTTNILGGGPIAATPAGGTLELTIGAFDVINLETPDIDAFNADFTGTLIEADQPVAVFVGSEASDAPSFDSLVQRRCCADHLEEQLDPVRTAGKQFVFAHTPSRTQAVAQAGGELGLSPEPDYVRFVATSNKVATITTSLAAPNDVIYLTKRGDFAEVEVVTDFVAESDQPIHAVQVCGSQDAAGVPRELPGGDPSLLVTPPIEQYRKEYVFLTPDKYAFDFVTVVAPLTATVRLDGTILDSQLCNVRASDGIAPEDRTSDPEYITYQCQLSFATVNPDTGEITPGKQNDGVHRVSSNLPVGVTVFGFDRYVSYAYAGGTDLREIADPN